MSNFDAAAKQEQLQQLVNEVLGEAKRQGASQAEVSAHSNRGIAATVRLGETETIEHTADSGLGISVYFGRRKGSASTADLSREAIREAVNAACSIARLTAEDDCAGLVGEELLATEFPDLDLYHPWEQEIDAALEIALRCEDAARSADKRICNSEGVTLDSGVSVGVYGNSHGFNRGYPTSRHSVSCSVIARQGDSMQRDYWHTTARASEELDSPEAVGKRAAERTVARLNGRKLTTRNTPVLFRPEMAAGLLRNYCGAIRGSALYRQSSFLLDSLDTQVFPEWVQIGENPLKPRGLGSAPFDSEGVATRNRPLVSDGIVQSYLLSHYSACKLGMQSTGNAGGVRNLAIGMGDKDFNGLLKEMDTGLVVTEMMGQGSNPVTGDYSRGATGFWVEKGEILYPVEEITIAGNLRQMFMDLVAVGNDDDYPGSTRTGSWLIGNMMVAGE